MPMALAVSFLKELSAITEPSTTVDTPVTFWNLRKASIMASGSSTPSMYLRPSRGIATSNLLSVWAPVAGMKKMVAWNLSSMRIAPFVPRMVRTKNSSKPLVCACVTMKKPTPNTMPARLMSIERRLAVRKRRAMRRLVDTARPVPGRLILRDHGADPLPRVEPVLLLDDDLFARVEPLHNFQIIEAVVALLHLAQLDLAASHHVDVVADERPARDDDGIGPLGDDDAHLAGQAGHHRTPFRQLDVEVDRVAL